ncbi:Uncharacterized protein DAT39_020360 [Clarias magur]|uniref:Uncharacterized protein n=1 Tax=Clarias magur TaxID=1594786 RepID=A0A8J4TF54_CLAMG|nr:Uncharacterized protein DAT39_020360 [Clarias magur]
MDRVDGGIREVRVCELVVRLGLSAAGRRMEFYIDAAREHGTRLSLITNITEFSNRSLQKVPSGGRVNKSVSHTLKCSLARPRRHRDVFKGTYGSETSYRVTRKDSQT